MIIIEDTIVSEDLIGTYFSCKLSICNGLCCIEGDAGAPLDESEINIIKKSLSKIQKRMSVDGLEIIKKKGFVERDVLGNLSTALINGKECVFTYKDGDTTYCAIEKAYNSGDIDFIKPISCHLYPVRLSRLYNSVAINVHKWDICRKAFINGRRENIPLYKFLRIPLIRRFGKEWYRLLEEAVKISEERGK